ncbi:OsmC family peroxiredoxin [Flavobacterium sp. UBA4197]|uniref:OsmC family peroxiredoxin n=1 Tax=Flavobacterium sp. UBA4197 TaxID=1946546 RepID=UPI00257D65C3|nr:OsmC family peroxiredoxin [Flavobacterium sp. UBA4197]
MKRRAKAVWNGNIKGGNGHLTTNSLVLNKTQYSFNSRFAEGIGTNPEELLAAAHAGCFTMKLSLDLTTAGYTAEELTTESTVTLNDGKITQSLLILNAKVPGISDEEFQQLARQAEATYPVSQAFNFEIILQANLI